MVLQTENTTLMRHALTYVGALYRELSQENGAPTLGTQNQAVDFILADPALSQAVADWAGTADTDEASTAPPQRLPRDTLYRRVREYLEQHMERPVFLGGGPGRPPGVP